MTGRKVRKWFAIAAGYYLAVAAALYVFQRDFLYFPDRQRPDFRATGISGLREIALVTSDALRLLAWYLPPAPGKPVVVYFHGNAGNLQNRGVQLSAFAKAGIGVLMPEYRGYGGNDGQPSEAGFTRDAAAAMSFLRKEGYGAERIVVYGESIGTGVATRVASEQPVAALVLESPYTSVTDLAAEHFFFLPVGLLMKDRFDSLARIARVQAPLLILQGARDDIVSPALGRELFGAAREPKELWSAPQGGHNDLHRFGAGEAVLDFLRRHVPSAVH